MKLLVSVILGLILISCSNSDKVKHSFFIAGHTYGSPKDKGIPKGLYKPFKDKIQFINNEKTIKQGFLLGDVVWKPNAWPEAVDDISEFSIPIHIVRGNHDGPLNEFENRFGKSFKKFIQDDDLFIILDPNLDDWSISDDQLVFLMNTLRNDSKKVNNIFVFTHQVLWWSKNKLSKPRPNSLKNRHPKTNFWGKIEPILQNLNKPVFLFAGDVGAFSKEHRKRNYIIEYFYYNKNNVTYISSGMGGGVRDNIVIVDVFNNGSVEFRLVHLNGDNIDSLGKLEDYDNPN